MPRHDYLITQIHQLGRFIRLMMERLQGKTSSLNLDEEMIAVSKEFREKSGFEMSLLATPFFDELKAALVENSSYNPDNLELLADYMVVLADKFEFAVPTFIHRLKSNALQLYEMIEVNEKTYSLERQRKIAELKGSL